MRRAKFSHTWSRLAIRCTIRLAAIAVVCLQALAATSAAELLEQTLLQEGPAAIATDVRRLGDPQRGAAIFYARAMACATCHSVGERAESIGPDLAKLDAHVTDAELIEAILEPSKKIAAAYASTSVETVDGKLLAGLVAEETADHLVLRDAAQPDKLITIRQENIASRDTAKQSIMPAGQVNQLSDRGQFLDLVSYLIALREGGPQRARQLQPPPDPLAMKVPDDPLPWQPVVQRGEVTVTPDAKYPHAVAMGFDGGTLLFDANRLDVVAFWLDGFVRSSPQNYFGLYWHRDGELREHVAGTSHRWRLRTSAEAQWKSPEPTTTSDPNTGTRFDGYQIGHAAVRLHYRWLVGDARIAVQEDIRVEKRSKWRGYTRRFSIVGLPEGAQLSLALPAGSEAAMHNPQGEKVDAESLREAPLVRLRSEKSIRCVRGEASVAAQWVDTDQPSPQLLLSAAERGKPLVVRLDVWHFQSSDAEPTSADLAHLVAQPPMLDDSFDAPRRAPAPLPLAEQNSQTSIPQRPAVQPHENIDEFAAVTGRYLRFVVTRTVDNAEPGIDELEIYGTDPKTNLALKATASASSVIQGYAIHQIAHLNDGQHGNPKSWISGEPGKGSVQLEFPEPVELRKVVWARDRTGVCKDRLITGYRIEVSADGQLWKKVADDTDRTAARAIGAIRRDAYPGYVMEAIPGPFPSWRPADVVFDDEGAMYAVAMTEGQVWRARTPSPDRPEEVRWQRFACGLYHPTGLAIVDGRIYVAQKPEITELIDRDGDGAADHYRTVATGWGLSTGWHEYCFGLAVDSHKNLWFTLNTGYFWTNPGFVNPGRWRGSVMRVSHEAEKLEVVATGCRVPNGVATGPDGQVFFTDNQGDWIQVCKLAHVVKGRFYGHPETKADALPEGEYPNGRSAIWFPYDRGRSVSGPAYDSTAGKFGPFAGQLFVGDVGYGANAGILRVALEKVNGEYQGACFGFIDGQPLGCQRMKFGPDNQLYMTSLTTGLTRLAYRGGPPLAIESMRIRAGGKGFVIRFTKPLAQDVQLPASQIRVQRYHYLYTGNYGSPKADEKTVAVERVEISDDGREVTLTLPVESHPLGMVYELNLGNLSDAAGDLLLHPQAWYTVHQIPK